MKEYFFLFALIFSLLTALFFFSGCQKIAVHDNSPDFDNSALIIVHMQNDVVKEGGFMDFLPQDNYQSVIPEIKELAVSMRNHGRPVIYSYLGVQDDYSDALWPFWKYPDIDEKSFFVRDTWGVRIIDELTPDEDDIIIENKGYNSFFNSKLDRILKRKKINTVIIVGVQTNTCIFSTVAGGVELKYQVVVVEDATASWSEETHLSTLETIDNSFATIVSTDYVKLKLKY